MKLKEERLAKEKGMEISRSIRGGGSPPMNTEGGLK
jgi:hypothetical protein